MMTVAGIGVMVEQSVGKWHSLQPLDNVFFVGLASRGL